MNREPCFDNLLKVLNKEIPSRPTLFEFFLNKELYEFLAQDQITTGDFSSDYKIAIKAFQRAGYDYATLRGSEFWFESAKHESKQTTSSNAGAIITNREDFFNYKWPNPEECDYSRLKECENYLPEGMKIIVWGPGGVLENVIELVGYDNLCYMIIDEPELAMDIFEAVGSRLIKYYEICAGFNSVGALISNDDWGFNTQTMLSPEDMRRYVFPYHKKIVEVIHKNNKPAILHSCGNLESVFNDIVNDMCYDAKHSYEDKILPVEEAYKKYVGKIAVLGGIDLDFICRETPENIKKRCVNMLKAGMQTGGYALGTGNSVPNYVPRENYFAMLSACENF